MVILCFLSITRYFDHGIEIEQISIKEIYFLTFKTKMHINSIFLTCTSKSSKLPNNLIKRKKRHPVKYFKTL